MSRTPRRAFRSRSRGPSSHPSSPPRRCRSASGGTRPRPCSAGSLRGSRAGTRHGSRRTRTSWRGSSESPPPPGGAGPGLLRQLDRDEVETVVAHELMHLKHHDAGFKVFSRVFSRILFFDPFSKFFDPAVHREREYLADEAGGPAGGEPAALAPPLP